VTTGSTGDEAVSGTNTPVGEEGCGRENEHCDSAERDPGRAVDASEEDVEAHVEAGTAVALPVGVVARAVGLPREQRVERPVENPEGRAHSSALRWSRSTVAASSVRRSDRRPNSSSKFETPWSWRYST